MSHDEAVEHRHIQRVLSRWLLDAIQRRIRTIHQRKIAAVCCDAYVAVRITGTGEPLIKVGPISIPKIRPSLICGCITPHFDLDNRFEVVPETGISGNASVNFIPGCGSSRLVHERTMS